MAIPTEEEIIRELNAFLTHDDVNVKEKANKALETLNDLSQPKFNEGEAQKFADDLATICKDSDHTYNLVSQPLEDQTILFQKTLYHAFLYIAYHCPRNDKENDIPLDMISHEPIAEENLFISFDQRHWDADELATWCKTKGLFNNPHTSEIFSPQEIKWIRKIAKTDPYLEIFNQAMSNLGAWNEVGILQTALNYFALKDHHYFTEDPDGHANNIIEHLARILEYHHDQDIRRQAIKILLVTLPANTEPRRLALLTLLKHDNNDVVMHTIGLLTRLAKNNLNNQIKIYVFGGIPALLECLKSNNNAVILSQVFTCCVNLCENNSTNRDAFRNAGALPILISLVNEDLINQPYYHSSLIKILEQLIDETRYAVRNINQPELINPGMKLLSCSDRHIRYLGRLLLNDIQFPPREIEENNPSLTSKYIHFDVFVKRAIYKAIDASMFLSSPYPRTYKKERLQHYIDFVQALLEAGAALPDKATFKQRCLDAIAAAKPHIRGSAYGAAKRLFREQDSFEQQTLEMERILESISNDLSVSRP